MADTGDRPQDAASGTSDEDAHQGAIFAVMGTTGSGKSTFIQKASGRQDVIIGHGLQSCTAKPYLYGFSFEGRSVALLDTPGFDDTYKTDAEVLQTVADFLAQTYKINVRLSGIIYLQRITDPRITHGGRENLAMFRALCGDDPLRKVILATTFWGEMTNLDRAKEHEEQLRTTADYWGDMLAKNATMTRFHDSQESAWQILRSLLEKEEKISLKIQQEMVDQSLDLDKTTAGASLNRELSRMAEKYARDLHCHREEMQAALATRDVELREIKEEQARKTEELLQHMRNQKELLNARRRDDLRVQDMQFDTRFRKMLREQETEAIKQLEDEIQQLSKVKEGEGQGNDASEEHGRYEDVVIGEKQRAKAKRERRLEIMGALGTTVTAVGLAVINPLAIPVAFGGLISVINACFSRRDERGLERQPESYSGVSAI